MVDTGDRVGVCPATVGLHRRTVGVRDPRRLRGMAVGHPSDGHRNGRHSARRRAPHQRPVHPVTRDRLELGGRPGPPRADRLSTGCVRRLRRSHRHAARALALAHAGPADRLRRAADALPRRPPRRRTAVGCRPRTVVRTGAGEPSPGLRRSSSEPARMANGRRVRLRGICRDSLSADHRAQQRGPVTPTGRPRVRLDRPGLWRPAAARARRRATPRTTPRLANSHGHYGHRVPRPARRRHRHRRGHHYRHNRHAIRHRLARRVDRGRTAVADPAGRSLAWSPGVPRDAVARSATCGNSGHRDTERRAAHPARGRWRPAVVDDHLGGE